MTEQTPSTEQRVADLFVEILRLRIGSESFDEMRRLNVAEPRGSVCHSHDFCDANEVMADAVRGIVGEAPYDSNISQARTDALTETFNAAWRLADPIMRTLPEADTLRTADALFTEIEELYLSGILNAPDEDDADDPRRPLYDAVNAYRAARGGKVS